ncbi:MAG: PIN domain-containing protein [Vulcanimicrobiota bacterium]
MKESSFIDTNVFLRFFTADIPEQSLRAKALIERLEEGTLEAYVSDLVFAELVWVMKFFYGLSPADIFNKLSFLLNLRGLKVANRSLLLEALTEYVTKNVDFIDSYNASFMRHRSIDVIFSYDRDFDRLGVIRKEP